MKSANMQSHLFSTPKTPFKNSGLSKSLSRGLIALSFVFFASPLWAHGWQLVYSINGRPGNKVIKLKVMDEHKNPIEGVSIRVKSGSQIIANQLHSSAAGKVSFAFKGEGPLFLLASKDLPHPHSEKLVISKEDIELNRTTFPQQTLLRAVVGVALSSALCFSYYFLRRNAQKHAKLKEAKAEPSSSDSSSDDTPSDKL